MYIIAIGIILGIATGLCWGLYPIYAKKQKGTPDH
jgi:drug/metabolite transporter (DMT)-like permease